MASRSFGWIQNPSDFNKLKATVRVFDAESDVYKDLRDDKVRRLVPLQRTRERLQSSLDQGIDRFTYQDLVGTSTDAEGKSAAKRSAAVADSLLQLVVQPQSAFTQGKEWTDNWTADGFLRWAVSFGFVCYDRASDSFAITDLGREFSVSAKEVNEDEVFIKALLAYPPATRVLGVLEAARRPLNKFEIGQKLGFKGEPGFTSYPAELMDEWLRTEPQKKDQSKIRSDIEGTSDKYSRMIAGWLSKVGYVKKSRTQIEGVDGRRGGFTEYSITAKGSHALRQAEGASKNARIEKFLMWEFLSIGAPDRDYVRSRRAHILNILQTTRSINSLLSRLQEAGYDDAEAVILNDIEGFVNAGIRIEVDVPKSRVTLLDRVNTIDIPVMLGSPSQVETAVSELKEELMRNTALPAKYYELVDIARDKRRARDFEIMTADLLINVYDFEGSVMGGGRRPDVIVYQVDEFGLVIDTKAYKDGYGRNIAEEDKMVRYMLDNRESSVERNRTLWWEKFPAGIASDRYYFLWIASRFKPNFEEQVESTVRRSGNRGSTIEVADLLRGADLVAKGKMTNNEFERRIGSARIEFSDIG